MQALPRPPRADSGAGDSVGERIANGFHRGDQMPGATSVPNQTALRWRRRGTSFDKYIEFLVANGADLTAKDANTLPPLDVARGASTVFAAARTHSRRRWRLLEIP